MITLEARVVMYDREVCLHVCDKVATLTGTLVDAQQIAKRLWGDLEAGQPKQIFIKNLALSKVIYYYDNFDKVYSLNPIQL